MDSSLCRYNFHADNCEGPLERTRQTTVGAILADSHMRPLPCRFAKKITHVTYKETKKSQILESVMRR